MKEKITDYILHQEIHWVTVDNERLQLCQPNGDNITFDKQATEIANLLNFLKNPSDDFETIDDDLLNPLIELLISKGFLIKKKEKNNSQFERIANLHPNDEIKYKESRLQNRLR